MIRKVTNEEYMKRLGNMTAVEKEAYLKRVGEWLAKDMPLLEPRANDDGSRFINVMQSSGMWDDDVCRAWERGAVLLTALVATCDTWLPDTLYTKSTQRVIRNMIQSFEKATTDFRHTGMLDNANNDGRPARDASEGQPDGRACRGIGICAEARADSLPLSTGGSPIARPKHIDQYVHLFPQKTQERAAKVGDMLRELDEARRKLDLLIDDPHTSGESRANWARRATKLDEGLKKIYKELDREWAKAVEAGKVVVDDLGVAHVVEVKSEEVKSEKCEADDKRKAALLRKWLIDKRNAKSEAQQKKWLAKYQEMVKLGGEAAVTDKVREAAAFYGVSL